MSRRQAARRSTATAILVYLIALAAAAPAQPCPGDCDADGQVSLAEAVLAMRISLERGGAQLADCPAADTNLDGVVGVGDAMRAAAAMQNGCAGAASAASGAATSGVGGTPFVEVSMESGAPGQTVEFSVTLHTAGQDIAGVEQEIHLDGLTPVQGCQANPAIDKNASAFSLRPFGCAPGVTCTSLKALILSFSNVDPIPDGSVLFTCEAIVSGAAPGGTYPLDSRLEGAADPDGNEVLLDGVDGSISVAAVPTATPTPIPVQASLILEKVRLKADTADRPGRDNATVAVVGVVNANDPFASFVEDIGASGLSVRVFGAGGVDEVLPWSAGECEVRAAAGRTADPVQRRRRHRQAQDRSAHDADPQSVPRQAGGQTPRLSAAADGGHGRRRAHHRDVRTRRHHRRLQGVGRRPQVDLPRIRVRTDPDADLYSHPDTDVHLHRHADADRHTDPP
jgi:hypothetical protein